MQAIAVDPGVAKTIHHFATHGTVYHSRRYAITLSVRRCTIRFVHWVSTRRGGTWGRTPDNTILASTHGWHTGRHHHSFHFIVLHHAATTVQFLHPRPPTSPPYTATKTTRHLRHMWNASSRNNTAGAPPTLRVPVEKTNFIHIHRYITYSVCIDGKCAKVPGSIISNAWFLFN